jgi:hypothetical protein
MQHLILGAQRITQMSYFAIMGELQNKQTLCISLILIITSTELLTGPSYFLCVLCLILLHDVHRY